MIDMSLWNQIVDYDCERCVIQRLMSLMKSVGVSESCEAEKGRFMALVHIGIGPVQSPNLIVIQQEPRSQTSRFTTMKSTTILAILLPLSP
jgi:hypothetical protein